MKQKTLEDFKNEEANLLGFDTFKSYMDTPSHLLPDGLDDWDIVLSIYSKASENYANYKAGIAFKKGCEAQIIKCVESIHGTDNGREGCTYGDTEYDSQSVCYGYNNCVEDAIKSVSKSKLADNPYVGSFN